MNSLPFVAAATLRTGARLVSRVGGGALLILAYHRVLKERDPLLPDEPDAREFGQHLDVLQSVFNVLPLMEAFDRMRTRSLPARAVCITFDDGYANNCDVAAPLLAARGLPATIFIAPGFLEGGRMFNDTVIEALRRAPTTLDAGALGLGVLQLTSDVARRSVVATILEQFKYLPLKERQRAVDRFAEQVGATLPSDLMMTRRQVRGLAKLGVAVGAHTVNHPILARMEPAEAAREIHESRRILQDITGEKVEAFAYPNGRPRRDYDGSHVAMVGAAGFRVAVSTAWGRADWRCDPLQLPRIMPWDRKATRFVLRMLRACTQTADRVAVPVQAAGG